MFLLVQSLHGECFSFRAGEFVPGLPPLYYVLFLTRCSPPLSPVTRHFFVYSVSTSSASPPLGVCVIGSLPEDLLVSLRFAPTLFSIVVVPGGFIRAARPCPFEDRWFRRFQSVGDVALQNPPLNSFLRLFCDGRTSRAFYGLGSFGELFFPKVDGILIGPLSTLFIQ